MSNTILGSDFLAKFYLAPNHQDALVLNLHDFSTLPAKHVTSTTYSPINFIVQMEDPCYPLLDSFPEILTPLFTITELKHGVHHYGRTDCQYNQEQGVSTVGELALTSVALGSTWLS